MKIIPIFEPRLYAFRYKNESIDELERLFREWNDIEYLESFFEENKDDLKYFKIDVEEAINETFNEAQAFQNKLFELAQDENQQLDAIFRNLNNEEYRLFELTKQKSRRRWLRIYAIRIDTNVYAITGGAIKLTKLMESKPHTQKELDKLDRCKNYLKGSGVFDIDSFNELICEKL